MNMQERLEDLARRVDRNLPASGDPERFHIEKSEIVDALRRMARNFKPQPRKEN